MGLIKYLVFKDQFFAPARLDFNNSRLLVIRFKGTHSRIRGRVSEVVSFVETAQNFIARQPPPFIVCRLIMKFLKRTFLELHCERAKM